jgi:hypothetical protein
MRRLEVERTEGAPEMRRQPSVAAAETPRLVRRPRADLRTVRTRAASELRPGQLMGPCQELADGGRPVRRIFAVCSRK